MGATTEEVADSADNAGEAGEMFVEEADDDMDTDASLGAELAGLRARIKKLEKNLSTMLRSSIFLKISVLKNLGVPVNADNDDLARNLDDIVKSMVKQGENLPP